MALDGVQPARVGRRVDGLDVVGGHECLQPGVLVRAQVIHHDVEANLQRVAGPQPREDREKILYGLALAHLADETVGVDVIEGEELLGAMQSPVRRPEALRMSDWRPAASRQGPQLERATLVEADDRPTFGTTFVEVEDGGFFDPNSGSGDCFQVFVCW